MMNDYPTEIRQQAAAWALKLTEAGPDAAQQQALQHWLAQDPRHHPALEQAQALWQALGVLNGEQQNQLRAAAAPRPRRAPVRWSIAACALLALCAGVLWGPGAWVDIHADYHTASGQIRHLRLPDGSQVDMDSDTAVALEYSGAERRVRLLRGNAWFTVVPLSPSEPRPFRVAADNGVTQALGTQFMVQYDDSATTVGVAQHSVQVAAGAQSLVLQEQQAATYDAHQGLKRIAGWNSHDAGDWRRGLLIFHQQPLAEVIARINRYHRGKVIVRGARLQQRQISGVFSLGDLDNALATISHELGARQLTLPGLIVLY
ncbi:FecR family protein [Gibbsiella quercinecans]|nr:FecR domain-containing protein [Gibbsiella quercinecans]TCT88867.1 FecR family protein [Gibbsiella quercinecans]